MSKVQDRMKAVAANILSDLADGTAPWERPWRSKDGTVGLPVSGRSGKPYRGVNVFSLWLEMTHCGYFDNRWYTFKQALALGEGVSVKKGEKSTPIFFMAPTILLAKPLDGKRWWAPNHPKLKAAFPGGLPEDAKKMWQDKMFFVFNAHQIENHPDLQERPEGGEAPVDPTDQSRYAEAEALAERCAVEVPVKSGGNRACYSPVLDRIAMPDRVQFKNGDAYYATLFHENCHASGHPSRLAREFGGSFGDELYAKEELVAESGAAFVMATLGLPYSSQHASYLASWAKDLAVEDDKESVILQGISRGQRAADCVLAGLQSDKSELAAA